ncbi:MAG: FHA domain-containing protein [Planctomycetes bacterium]|nr:FHA domain-containing protein [Planctomycetota bacterium]
MWVLVLELDKNKRKEILLHPLPMLIGRGKKDHICIAHESLSPTHARFFERSGTLYIADLESDQGTRVNGRKIVEAPLRAGDRIELGAARFHVSVRGTPSATCKPPVQPVPGKAPNRPVKTPSGIKIKQDLLQYHKKDPGKGGSLLRSDFSQMGGGFRYLLLLILGLAAVGIFLLSRWLTEWILPD